METTPLYWFGVFILFIGWTYALLPHVYHEQIPLGGFSERHGLHEIAGLALVVVGLVVLMYEDQSQKAKGTTRRRHLLVNRRKR